jgi:hypothetical protein
MLDKRPDREDMARAAASKAREFDGEATVVLERLFKACMYSTLILYSQCVSLLLEFDILIQCDSFLVGRVDASNSDGLAMDGCNKLLRESLLEQKKYVPKLIDLIVDAGLEVMLSLSL